MVNGIMPEKKMYRGEKGGMEASTMMPESVKVILSCNWDVLCVHVASPKFLFKTISNFLRRYLPQNTA
jgi:hypothetical protein